MFSWFRNIATFFKARRGRKHYEKHVDTLISKLNIKDPLVKNATGYICLGDLFLESALDAKALNNILEGYGISTLGEAIDPHSSPVVETLARMGKDSYFVDGFGNELTDPNFIPDIVPKSNLYRLSEYINNTNWSDESLGGHVAESVVRNAIENEGYKVMFPKNHNQEGFDLLIERKWFEDNNLPFVSDSDLSFIDNPTGMGVLQVKNAPDSTELTKHFTGKAEEVAKIPVITPDGTSSSGMLDSFQDRIIEFSSVKGLSSSTHSEIIEQTKTAKENIAAEHFGFIDSGTDIHELSNAAEGYYGFNIPDIDGLDIPYIGLLITAYLSSSRSYKMYSNNQIELPEAVLNTSKDITTAGIAGIGGMAASGFVASQVLENSDGVTEVWSGVFGGVADGLDWSDLEDFAELGLVVGAGVLAYRGIKKLLGFGKSDPLKELKAEIGNLNEAYGRLSTVLKEKKDDIVTIAENFSKDFHLRRLNKINEELHKLPSFKEKSAKPLIYYFLIYAKYKQKRILKTIDNRKSRFPHGKIEASIERLVLLEKARKIRFKRQSNQIKMIYNQLEDKDIKPTYKNIMKNVKINKVEVPKVLENLIQAELLYAISIIDNISMKESISGINKLNPLINLIKKSLKKISEIHKDLKAKGALDKPKLKPST